MAGRIASNSQDKSFYFFFILSFPGISKKIDAMAKVKNCTELAPWRKSIVNHLHWSSSTSKSGAETVAKWKSVANHVQDIHTHDDENFLTCLHEPLIGEDARQWLKPSMYRCFSESCLQKSNVFY